MLLPTLPSVKDGDDFETVASQPVRNDKRSAGNDEFSGTGHSAGAANIRQGSQTVNRRQQRRGDPAGSAWVLVRDSPFSDSSSD